MLEGEAMPAESRDDIELAVTALEKLDDAQ